MNRRTWEQSERLRDVVAPIVGLLLIVVAAIVSLLKNDFSGVAALGPLGLTLIFGPVTARALFGGNGQSGPPSQTDQNEQLQSGTNTAESQPYHRFIQRCSYNFLQPHYGAAYY